MACDVICIPITTVSHESSFSVGSQVFSKYKRLFLPSNVQVLICARNCLCGLELIGEFIEFIIEFLILSNFSCFVGGCDLDEEDKENGLDEELEESGRKQI